PNPRVKTGCWRSSAAPCPLSILYLQHAGRSSPRCVDSSNVNARRFGRRALFPLLDRPREAIAIAEKSKGCRELVLGYEEHRNEHREEHSGVELADRRCHGDARPPGF